ncbi:MULTISPECIES: threonine ammonia-lyase, biosynthetic [Acinetobacter]|jgi:threonine dehydratase|uniref:L-threonine dehydratase n=5 Tax=Acinetobacter TaxID=469 RepID=F0KFR8_ACIP2|nr:MULTISPECIES: threonine ammonia-lyase, biosynthetic [Acinetobacter]YP_004995665.1 threonine dehydratase biosynthetic (threonine deaminase) [Acinetobacter pittii PHEA-2]MDR0068063.1 threonine ammonia-lyase, biosynthetic [Acinetobacter sp. 11520]ADY81983.1 threonine dehydratase biosynthetic (threonine deaminase) [Acinetobacter pittii PHEA-2]MBJ8480847.1 threonine ammonia-lyase, biosynthetic [Acinetobacter pittii]MBJ8486786.1 threonine ammonia-lyase, biosynthetic [Acinetobacter pittii]MBJ9719
MNMLSRVVRQILQATVYDVAIETPLEAAPRISQKLNNTIRFKREDLQPVFSFKLRGAYNRISQLPKEQLERGVICASAGNHAQGVALSGQRLGIPAIIVMPSTTPDIKVQAVKRLGGQVVLHGDSFDIANKYAQQRAEVEGLVFIPPYDDELVIAGQGTIANEILRQWRDVEYVFVAVGGGGLISGVAAYLGEVAPHVKVIGVEYEESACLKAALEANERVILPHVGLFADGTAVAQIGALPFDIIRLRKSDNSGPIVDPDIVTVNTDEICAAIKDTFDENRSIVEPSGAMALAGIKKYIHEHKISNKNMVSIVCGANMNFDRLRYIAERTELGEQREAIYAVTLSEEKGAFLGFCRALQGRNITEFNYRANNTEEAQVFVGISLKGGDAERHEILEQLKQQDYIVDDLSDDEVAKLHIRYLIGGHANLDDERLFRVEFPERPGALLTFLTRLGPTHNITLFHYRNHGAAEGRVLVGLQATDAKQNPDGLIETLEQINYPYAEITDNVGYKRFLK